jgi:DNA-binding transcriptional LysR family regulator
MNKMELRHLRYFVTVAKELHFARAANKLNIAQPALSLQIQALEAQLGVKLLLRTTRNVELTDSGLIFYERALAILDEVQEATVMAQVAAGEEVKKIRIGTIYPATFGFLPKLLNNVRSRYPDLQIHLMSDTSDNIVREIERGRLNLGFIRPAPNMASLSYSTLRSERYFLAVPRDVPLAKKRAITFAQLKHQKLVCLARSNLTRSERYFSKLFQAHGLLDNIAYTVEDTLSMLALVSAGAAAGFVPEWVSELPKDNYILKCVKELDLEIGLAIAWKKDDPTHWKDDIVEMAKSFAQDRST